jgi:hypothetical protein
MPTAREIIMAAWFGPIIDPDYKSGCDRAPEREENWYQDFYGTRPTEEKNLQSLAAEPSNERHESE